MVLDHVAGGADAVVVAGAPAQADVFRHGDLHVIDVVGVPHRLKHLVGEAQRKDVLDRFLAQVVVDAEHGPLIEHRADDLVELLGRLEVVAERLFNDHAAPLVFALVRHAGAIQLVDNLGEELRRHGQVVGPVAGGAALVVAAFAGGGEPVEGGVVVEVALDKLEAFGEALPDVLVELGACAFVDSFAHVRLKVGLGPVAPPVADQREPAGQKAAVGQVVDGRQQLLACKVAGHPEDHHAGRPGDLGEAFVGGGAQRVVPLLVRRSHVRRA